MNGLRTSPSPCSPDSAPPNSSTRSATSLAIASNVRTPVVGLQVDHRPHVQAADRGVRVDAGRRAVRCGRWRGTGRCSRAASRARPPCPRRTTATWRRPSSPSTGRAPLRAGSRSRACAGEVQRAVVAVAEAARARRSRSSASSRGGRSSASVGVELDAQQRAGIALDEGAAHAIERRALLACCRG